MYDHQQEDIAKMAEAIATRRRLPAPDDECSLLASVCLLTYRRALSKWLAGPAKSDPAAVVEAHLKLLHKFARPAASTARRNSW